MTQAPFRVAPLLVGVGGFLGAGKTTAIVQAASRLRAAGRRVAVITNDQASGLVDTHVARAALEEFQDGSSVAEIAGGCFCCRFDDLAQALRDVIDRSRPDVILAEAVGSCTDLAATVYQPIRQLALAPVRLGPLTVVADATRLRAVARFGALPRLSPDVSYLFGQQLAEADLLLLNKTDAIAPDDLATVRRYVESRYPGVPVVPVSALRGEGLDAWLDVLAERADAGCRVLDLDYDRYADAEAALGWLNLDGSVKLAPAEHAAHTWLRAALAEIARRADDAGAEVAHVKALLATGTGAVRAHLAGGDPSHPPFTTASGTVTDHAALTLNARVAAPPEALRGYVHAALRAADAATGARTLAAETRCFAPARPTPTYRLAPI